MDEGTTGVETSRDADSAAAIEKEIEVIRDNLDGLVSELDQRRHRLNPIEAARRHPAAFAVAGVVIVGAVTATILIHRAKERRRHSWQGSVRGLMSMLMDRIGPRADTIAPNVGMRVLGAVASAAAVLGQHLVMRRFAGRPDS